MGRGTGMKSWQQRERIVQAAARIMAEEGVKDYFLAKQKAADRLGVARNSPNLPRNAEIEVALAAYQRLFLADIQPTQLRRMREIACEAMHFFRSFHPRLVGPVLSGLADYHSEIALHLFAESLEQVVLHLTDAGIPHHLEERRLRMGIREQRPFPMLRFLVDGVPIAAVVFDVDFIRQAPVSPTTGRPMERASLAHVQHLLSSAAAV